MGGVGVGVFLEKKKRKKLTGGICLDISLFLGCRRVASSRFLRHPKWLRADCVGRVCGNSLWARATAQSMSTVPTVLAVIFVRWTS